MIFNWVEIKNFKSYGDYETRIELNSTEARLLLGENGAGKTTFIDAIIWAIYGRSLSNVDEIINRTTKKNCKVEVNFDVGRSNYSILRYRSHDIHKNNILIFKDKENVSPRTANEAQNYIIDLIEINYESMVSSIIFSSELYISFLRAKPSDRLKIFDNILSLKEIQEYYEIIKKMRKPLLEKIDKNKNDRDRCDLEISTTENNIEQYKEKVRNSLLDLKNLKEKLIEEKEQIKYDLDTLNKIDVKVEIGKNEEFNKVKENNELINKQIDLKKSGLKNIEELADKLEKIKIIIEKDKAIDIKEELDKIRNFNQIRIENNLLKSQFETKAAMIKNTNSMYNDIEVLEKRILEIKKEIEDIKNNAEVCPTCGQEVSTDLTNSLISKKEDIIKEKEIILINKAQEKNEALKNNIKISEEMNEILLKEKELPENSIYTEEFLSTLKEKLDKLENDIKSNKQEIIHAEEINTSINNDINKLKESLINKEIEPSAYQAEHLNNLKESMEEKNNRIAEIDSEINVINGKATSIYDKDFVKNLKEKVFKIRKLEKSINNKIIVDTLEDQHYDVLQQIFSNKNIGVKKFIIDKMLELFNDKINFYIPFFFSTDIKINFNKDLTEEIILDSSQISFSTFSSGEKTRLELGIAFSLFMLVKTFFSSNINILIFDEILDMNLDNEGVQSVLNIIDGLSKENSIIVISHREEYKENFPNQIFIKKDEAGFSQIMTR